MKLLVARLTGDKSMEAREFGFHASDHGFEHLGGDEAAAEALGEADNADLHRLPGAHAVT